MKENRKEFGIKMNNENFLLTQDVCIPDSANT